MSKCLGYRVDDKIKSDYDALIEEKYGYQRNKCGKSVANWMKFELALEGNELYQDDPDVIVLMDKVKEKAKHSSQLKSKENTLEERLERKFEEILERKFEEILERKFEEILERKFEEKFAQFEKKARREVSKRHGLAEFKKQFRMAFQDYHQVSREDMEHFIMNNDDILDKRAIRNRISYLESKNLIQTYAPNIYNVKI